MGFLDLIALLTKANKVQSTKYKAQNQVQSFGELLEFLA
jgi:hypothetical protein